MAPYLAMRCYHHSNCEDRPAVSNCTKCGKGLCRECTDNLRSEDTGKILCVDCLNKEIASDVGWALRTKKEIKKEILFIIFGFLFGLAVVIFLGYMSSTDGDEMWSMAFLWSLLLCVPTLFASFRTIVKKVGSTVDNFLLRIILFFIFCAVSPIIFIWRLVKRARDIRLMKRFAKLQAMKHQANQKYAKIAAQMTTRLTTEQIERDLRLKYAVLEQTNREMYERLVAAELAQKEAEQKMNLLKAVQLQKQSAKIASFGREQTNIKAITDEKDKKLKRAYKKAKKESRSVDDVDSDEDVA